MNLRVFFCLMACLSLVSANPIVRDRAFVVSERLTVSVSPSAAMILGHFRFQRTATNISFAQFWVPVWLPEPRLKEPAEADRPLRITEERLGAWRTRRLERKVRIRVSVGRDDFRPRGVRLIDAASSFGSMSARAGYRVAFFEYVIPAITLDAPEPLIISYQQALLRTKAHRSFYYIPSFRNRPRGWSPGESSQCTMTLRTDHRCRIGVRAGGTESWVEPGEELVLDLEDERAIDALVTTVPNTPAP